MDLITLGGLELPGSDFSRPKPLLLLAYLTLEGPRDRRHLAELFWPDAASPAGSLSKALGQLRRGAGELVSDDGNLLGSRVSTDAQAFLAAAGSGRLEEAVDLYRGLFLEGVEPVWQAELEEWVLRTREALAARLQGVLLKLGEQEAAAGRLAEAARFAERAYFLRSAPEPQEEDLVRIHALLDGAAHPLAREVRREAQAFGVELRAESRPEGPSPADTAGPPEEPGENPYKGLAFFREQDAELFFGRGRVTGELVLAAQRKPFVVALIGSSGSGKSSLVFAGLVPALRGTGRWRVASFRPGRDPFLSQALALVPWLQEGLGEVERLKEATLLAEALRHEEVSLSQVLEQVFQAHPEERALLVVDQFEELFTIGDMASGRLEEGPSSGPRSFLAGLLAAARRLDGSFGLVLTIRADFMASVLEYGPLVDVLQQGQFLLGPMNQEELREVIEAPAALRGVGLEEGLVERILHDVEDHVGSLPLLEFALSQLWDLQSRGRLSHRAYDAIGGVEQALTRHAERTFLALSPEDQEAAKHVFLQLVSPGEGREDTRRVATHRDLAGHWQLVGHLASAPVRLIVTGQDERGEQTAEVIHEALIRRWTRLRGWLDEHRGFRIWQERLRQEVRLWRSLGGDASTLLRGFRLEEADRRLEGSGTMFSADERAFIEASLEQQREEERREDRRRRLQEQSRRERETLQRRVTQLLGSALVVAAVLTGLALWQWRVASVRGTEAQTAQQSAVEAQLQAERQRDRAGTQAQLALARQLSAQALVAAQLPGANNGYYDRALLLASQANLLVETDLESYGTLLRVFQLLPPQLEAFLPMGSPAGSIAFSPDGRMLAAGGEDSGVMLWNVLAQEPPADVLRGHSAEVRSVAFSPDGTTLASGGSDNSIILWNLDTRQPVGSPLQGHADEVLGVAFSPDGTTLASGSRDGTVVLWNLDTYEPIGTLEQERPFPISSVAFSPDGTLLAGGTRDNSVVLWDVATRTTVGSPLRRHGDQIRSVAFSPDGTTLASGSRDGTVILWNLDTREPVGNPLQGHAGEVRSVAFGPDGTTLASGGSGGTVVLWQLGRENGLVEPIQEYDAGDDVFSVAFSPDGTTLASGSRDGTVTLWNLSSTPRTSQAVHERGDDVRSVAFSPDGTTLASGGRDGVITLRRLGQGAGGDMTLQGHESWIRSVAFGPDGTTLASGSRDGTIVLWNLDTRQPIGEPLRGHADEVRSVAFGPDGTTLASGGSDGTIILWNLDTREPVGNPLRGHSDWVLSVAFSPDGTTLASGSRDGTVVLWNLDAREPVGNPLQGHAGEVRSVAFSPDGTTLASGGSDGTVVLWNPLRGTPLAEPLRLHGDTGEVWSLAFDPHGRELGIGGRNGAIVLWRIGREALQERACRMAGRNLDRDEWQRYLDDLPYQPTCPRYAARLPAGTRHAA